MRSRASGTRDRRPKTATCSSALSPPAARGVRAVADARAVGADDEVAPRGRRQPGEQPQKRGLPAPVRPGDHGKPTDRDRDVDAAQYPLPPVALLDAATADHVTRTSRATNAKNTTLITPFIVKNAASRRRRSPGRTRECSYRSTPAVATTPSQ